MKYIFFISEFMQALHEINRICHVIVMLFSTNWIYYYRTNNKSNKSLHKYIIPKVDKSNLAQLVYTKTHTSSELSVNSTTVNVLKSLSDISIPGQLN